MREIHRYERFQEPENSSRSLIGQIGCRLSKPTRPPRRGCCSVNQARSAQQEQPHLVVGTLLRPRLHAELWFDDANNHRRGALTMRRLSIMFVLAAALAGCSSGSSNVAGSTQSTSPKATSSTSPKATTSASKKAPSSTSPKTTSSTSPKTTKVAVGTATSFCAAFKEMQSVKASAGAAAAGAAYQTVAAEMRKYAPAAIKAAAATYANVIDDSGKALKSGTLPTLAAKPADLLKVTGWVSKNCPLK